MCLVYQLVLKVKHCFYFKGQKVKEKENINQQFVNNFIPIHDNICKVVCLICIKGCIYIHFIYLDVHLVELYMMKNVWNYWLTQLSQPILCTLNMLVWTDYKHNWTLMFWWQASIRCVSYVSLNKECSTFQYYIYLNFCIKAFAQR